jgi:hypothetical protein
MSLDQAILAMRKQTPMVLQSNLRKKSAHDAAIRSATRASFVAEAVFARLLSHAPASSPQ